MRFVSEWWFGWRSASRSTGAGIKNGPCYHCRYELAAVKDLLQERRMQQYMDLKYGVSRGTIRLLHLLKAKSNCQFRNHNEKEKTSAIWLPEMVTKENITRYWSESGYAKEQVYGNK